MRSGSGSGSGFGLGFGPGFAFAAAATPFVPVKSRPLFSVAVFQTFSFFNFDSFFFVLNIHFHVLVFGDLRECAFPARR